MYFLIYLCVAIVYALISRGTYDMLEPSSSLFGDGCLAEEDFRNRKQSPLQVPSGRFVESEHNPSVACKPVFMQQCPLFPLFIDFSQSWVTEF